VVSMLAPLVEHPEHVFYLLGTALPRASTFFISFGIAQTLVVLPLRLLLPHVHVIAWVLLRRPASLVPKSLRQSQVSVKEREREWSCVAAAAWGGAVSHALCYR
jgi:hypothetical protein